MTKNYHFKVLVESLLLFLFLLVVNGSQFNSVYEKANEVYSQRIKEELLQTARAYAATVSGDLHQQILSPSDEKSSAYEEAIAPLKKLRLASKKLRYIYTVILKDGKIYFILDATPLGDADKDGVEDHSFVMDEYKDPDPTLTSALLAKRAMVSPKPYTDQWGTFISAYAPIYNTSNQFVGLLAIDRNYSDYRAELLLIRLRFLKSMIVPALAIILLIVIFYVLRFMALNAQMQLKHISMTDELTGLYNRRGFYEAAEGLLKLSKRVKKNYALLYFDINHFKQINDRWGHKEGDFALQAFSAILKSVFRVTDVLGRFGGDEFVVVALIENEADIQTILSRIEQSVQIVNKNSPKYTLAYSFGTSYSSWETVSSLEEAIKMADERMYAQKTLQKKL